MITTVHETLCSGLKLVFFSKCYVALNNLSGHANMLIWVHQRLFIVIVQFLIHMRNIEIETL